jgi:hypothetical protein
MSDVGKTEAFLGGLKRMPAPAGLRSRILDGAERRARDSRLVGPAGRLVLAASLALVVVGLTFDGPLSAPANRRILALSGGPGDGSGRPGSTWAELADDLGLSNGGPDLVAFLARRADGKRRKGRDEAAFVETLEEDVHEL